MLTIVMKTVKFTNVVADVNVVPRWITDPGLYYSD